MKSFVLSPGAHFFMNAIYSMTSGSCAHAGSPACFVNCVVRTPCTLSSPAGVSTVCTELIGLASNCVGFQFSSWTFLRAWAANFGVVTQRVLETAQKVLSIVVVLIEDSDFCVRQVLENEVAESGAFHLECRIERDSPWEIL